MSRRDEAIRMARECGMGQLVNGLVCLDWRPEIERFAALVAAAERERCAVECEVLYATGKYHPMLIRGSIRSAAAIRALKDGGE